MQTVKLPRAFGALFKRARYKVFYGGRGGGKSWQLGTGLLLRGMQSKQRFLCAREYQNSIADSVHKLLSDIIDRYGWGSFYTVTKDRITGRNGSEFIFCGLHHNVQEIKSKEGIDVCWVEEAHNVSAESWAVLIPTIRKDGSEIWISFNPQRRDDPTYDFVLHPRPDSIVKKVNWNDNPFFPAALESERRYMLEVDPEGYRHVWEGETVVLSDALVFNRKFETRTFDTPPDARFYFGADWGFSRDPSVLIRVFIQGDTLFIDHEAWGVQVDIDDLARYPDEAGRSMFDEVPGSRLWPIYADSARPETISYVAARGFHCEPADKWSGSIEDGIAFLRGFRKIVVHERCRHTLDEFQSYSYKVDARTGEILPKVEDRNNHCVAAGTLITTARGHIPVEQVTTEDQVLTRAGYKRVLWAGKTGENCAVIEIRAGDRRLVCTPEHLIYTINRGFVKAATVTGEDVLLCQEKQSCMTVLPGTDTPKRGAEATAFISSAQFVKEGKRALSGCTAISTSKRMAPFQKVAMFTTRTRILKTTRLRIWNVYPLPSTCINTRSRLSEWKRRKNILSEFDHLQRPGIEVPKVVRNIKKSAAWLIQTSSRNRKFARIAERRSCLMLSATGINSVQTPVNQHGDVNSISTTKKGSVQSVASPFLSASTVGTKLVPVRVQRVCALSENATVYDLTVEGQHEFLANGVLVHNCIDALRYALCKLIQDGDGVMTWLNAFSER